MLNISTHSYKILTLSVFADSPDLNQEETSHQHQHKSRRGRPRHCNDRNLSTDICSSQQCGHSNQGFKVPFSRNYLTYPVHEQYPPYHEDDGTRWRGRGRGRREGNRSVNGNFGGSHSSRQRPGGDIVTYSGNNRGAWPSQPKGLPRDGPDGPNWRRDAESNLDEASEVQDAQAKKPRKFSQEQRRGQHNEKSSCLKESSTTEGGEKSVSANRDTTNFNMRANDDHQKKHTEAKRRQGPIKPPKPSAQEEIGSERADSGQDEPGHSRPYKAGRDSGKHTPFLARGERRTYQKHRPGQKNWDKMPGSRETQTG